MDAEIQVVEFSEVPWGNRTMRGEGFGVRGNTYFSTKTDKPFSLHCPTGFKEESHIRLIVQMHGGWFSVPADAVFSDKADGTGTPIDMNGLFMSSTGKDKWPSKGFDGELNYRDPAQCLQPGKSYYLFIPVKQGHSSIRSGFVIRYISQFSDDVPDMALPGEPMIHPLTGEDGMWFPATPE